MYASELAPQYTCMCRQTLSQQLLPSALQPKHAEHEPLANAELQKLHAALQWEAKHQYVNFKASMQMQSRLLVHITSLVHNLLLIPCRESNKILLLL